MAMLDAFFNKAAFKGAKCKTLLRLTIPRIKLLRNRRELQLKQMRRDIAKLLENGQEATARIRVEHIIREENMMAAQEIIELFSELIAVRLPIIETQRECPLDLKEAISSICFAAPRCSDLPELQQVQMLFAAKYGREFVAAATELMPDCGVNRQIIELLSIRAPTVEAKLKLLKEIAEEHELDWDPTASESEFLKPHEDLLNGPNNFISGSTVPLPKEKHEPSLPCVSPVEESHDEHSSDAGLDTLDLPEVPSVPIRTISDITPSAPEFVPLQPPPTHDPSYDHVKPSPSDDDLLHSAEGPTASIYHPPTHSVAVKENKQFIPFVSSPVPPSSFVEDRSAATSVSTPSAQVNIREQRESLSHTKSEINTDLQDVLVAAQAAADTAERAAAAARAAASLAQVRIAELVSKRNNGICESIGNNDESSNQLELSEKPNFDQHQPSGHMDHVPSYGSAWRSDSKDESPKPQIAHQFQRSASLEDDSYFSYPNLFTSQDKNLKPGSQSSAGNSHSAHNF